MSKFKQLSTMEGSKRAVSLQLIVTDCTDTGITAPPLEDCVFYVSFRELPIDDIFFARVAGEGHKRQ
jgi:hypothetical protein